jgi:hypothetical protein
VSACVSATPPGWTHSSRTKSLEVAGRVRENAAANSAHALEVLELLHGRGRPEKNACVLGGLWQRLKRIDRYEQRDRSRRKLAIRDFNTAKARAAVAYRAGLVLLHGFVLFWR